ncbi:lactate utilization protein B [Kineosporia sp. R_H_3]|uniref:lactate utilization protein B n=1 Tax=Kineosporia sp. R_H_3 TaxID=1961848 RepID=UPI0018E9FC48|nr:lactate utilization protein B [Kineosporia sp. R_H_3]
MTTFLGMPGLPVATERGTLRGADTFPVAARKALADTQLRKNLGHATSTIRAKRARVVGELDDWEELRAAGAAIKADVMARLPELLVQLEENVTARGGHVHWARDADEANRIVLDLVRAAGTPDDPVTSVVKVKSMATQEIGLNEALAEAGIAAVETDLAELIVQLSDDTPSHILVPAIHRNRAEIRQIFLDHMPDVDPGLTDEPRVLAMAARAYLRRTFLAARVAVSGANFAIAETGTLAVVESEGNGRMCLTLPQTLVTVMGIEKLLPTWRDLEVFLQLLPRSSTGERMNPYTSMWTGAPKTSGGTSGGTADGAPDGPQEFHLVLLDNGRTATLADEAGRQALHCIRCSACLNVCPVYERTGGHAYGSVYPGPIGAVLTPQLAGMHGHGADAPAGGDPVDTLPYASSLCGACFDACPVRIDIPSMLVHLRAKHVETAQAQRRVPGLPASAENAAMSAAAWVMRDAGRFSLAEKGLQLGRVLARDGRIRSLPPPLSAWTTSRDAPAPPPETFRQWWARTRGDRS